MKLADIKDRIMPLLLDAERAEQQLENSSNEFTRRAYIRSVFAMIEGSIWILKQAVLDAPAVSGQQKTLTPAEFALLSDETYELKPNGDTKAVTKYLRLPENLKFTFRIIHKYFQIPLDLGVGSKAWDDFLAAQTVRNRITHPKTSTDYFVTDPEILIAESVCSWFNELMAGFFKGVVQNAAARGIPAQNSA